MEEVPIPALWGSVFGFYSRGVVDRQSHLSGALGRVHGGQHCTKSLHRDEQLEYREEEIEKLEGIDYGSSWAQRWAVADGCRHPAVSNLRDSLTLNLLSRRSDH